jgi:hypothetical protein
MPTYTAYFRTDAEFDMHDFEADTPAQALQMALELVERDPEAFAFESYDMLMPIDEIEISGPEGTELAVWMSDDLRVRLAAPELQAALEEAVRALNTAPRFEVPSSMHGDSYAIAALCDAALAKARPAKPST